MNHYDNEGLMQLRRRKGNQASNSRRWKPMDLRPRDTSHEQRVAEVIARVFPWAGPTP